MRKRLVLAFACMLAAPVLPADYPDLSTVRRALQSFPETIQLREKLWVRRFEMVQRLLE